MAINVLASSTSNAGSETCFWQVDYDSVAQNIGHTCTGQASVLSLTVTQVSTQKTFTKDILGDLNRGRVVDMANVTPAEVPVHVKGQVYPFQFASTWTP